MNVHAAALQPNLADINAQLYALFDPGFVNRYPRACIEIGYADPSKGNSISQAKVFSAFQIKEAAEEAARLNATGYNVYVGPALRTYGDREIPPDRRSTEKNYLASAFAWIDFDRAGDAARVQVTLQQRGIKPLLAITTGTTPHRRAQLLFRVSDVQDAAHQKRLNKALQTWLSSDELVVSPTNMMRLAGSVNYPTPTKVERGYVAELTTLRTIPGAPNYCAEQLLALAPDDDFCPFAEYARQNGVHHGKSDDDLIALLNATRISGQWHNNMRDAVASMVGKGWPELAIKSTCAPFADGRYDDEDVEKLIDSAVKKFSEPEVETTLEQTNAQQNAKASTALSLTYYNDLSDDPPPKPWIIKNVLARGETSNWFGPPGVGKSVLMTDLAFHVAAGMDWRGYRSKERCGVVYIALERGALVKRRLSVYMREHDTNDLPIAVASSVVDLKNPRCVKTIVETIREAEGRFGCKVGLIVIDTISKGIAAGGGDEDKAKDVNTVLANLRRVEELTDVHIACVGHTGKDEGRGHRGSNANLGDVDVMVQISGDSTKTATVIKANDSAEGPLTHYKIESAQLGTDEDGDPITTAIISSDAAEAEAAAKSRRGLSDTQRRALELLTRCINDQGRPPPPSTEYHQGVRVVPLKEWRIMCERGGLSSAEEKKDRDKAFQRAKDGLQTKSRIACLDGWVWLARDDG